MALIKKIYDNTDDFDKAVKDGKATEIFYKLAEQADKMNPKIGYYVITLSAVVAQDDRSVEQAFFQIINQKPEITTQKEYDAERERLKLVIDDLVRALQKEHSSYANIISGTQVIEV